MKTALLTSAALVAALVLVVTAAAPPARLPDRATAALTVEPAEVRLTQRRARQQLLVTRRDADGYLHDVTRSVTIEPADRTVAAVDADGVVRPGREGTTRLTVKGFGRSVEVKVIVSDPAKAAPVSYANEVMAVLGRAGCNAGGCHGHNSGKGDFKLSLRGHDLAADHRALSRQINPKEVEESQLLLRPTAQASHRGGKRFAVDSAPYAILKQWLLEGATNDVGRAARLERIEVTPASRLMPRTGLRQQLAVRAHFSDGTERDVTDQAAFELSAEGVVEVSPDGLVTGKREGEAAVLVRFLGQLGLSRFLVIRHDPAFRWSDPPENNFIDRHVHAKLKAIQVQPSALSTDAEFLRRVTLDVTGLVPTADEARAFLADKSADRREKKIDELLEREEFGEVWAAYWLELSGTSHGGDSAGFKGVWTLYDWLRDAVNRNLSYDRFVAALVAGRGSSLENPAIAFTANRLPAAEVVPQLFLGVRLECAQCHDHPFDVWKQSDYRALQAFFTDVATREGPGDPGGREIRRFVPPERFLPGEREKKVTLRLPDGKSVEVPAYRDRREVLVEWMFGAAGRKMTARALVNRVWGRLLGRGIVEPADDIRFSNPPVNEPLLDALADDFVAHGYDFERLVRTILRSRTYQLSSAPNASNVRETMNFSRARLRRLSAEQLLDSLSLITGVDEQYPGVIPGLRAVQIPYADVRSRFAALFGRPLQRAGPCECNRSNEATLAQVLHLLNGDPVRERVNAEGGTLRRLLAAHADDDRLVEELYLTVLARPPAERERRLGRRYLAEAESRAEGAEDLTWALLTSQEFLFNH